MYPPTAICRAFRIHGTHILPRPARFRMHGVRILPRTGDFPVRGRFRDAWSEKIATDCRPGTHFASILPSSSARERTAAESCHGKTPENAPREDIATASQAKGASGRSPATVGRWGGDAPRENIATTSRPRTHFAHILPSPGAWECIASISCHRQTSENAQRRHTATASRPSRSALHVGE